ncbi:collagenase-like protease [Candidatus Methanoperedens nitroreducens]|uniref:Collagenase-like protease n=1 Tax=Candidatus Methanoperedens nitratireducens TaxID=1392998 RepID=A0A062V8Y5_9EURY|nr:U32 family peptidase [Candidatus Methanoperedens nitroreducens]KCZ72978.1 collagenase-like protease [Candidatus Methanoperedens nitroreducens]MDJ1423079.1 DUF3656 domain-containing protein [Candidatus Methanoperedens sp.]
MHRPELLAPVGGREALIAAIENGADAVYFGGTAFSARQYASNFTREELEWAIDYAHIRGVRAYVTVNTLIKDSELEDACEYLQFLCNCGADAVIVQDLGILRLLRKQLPELPVHASTQMTIHNMEGVRFLQDMGVKRVVPARELSLDEIRRIRSKTRIEIETFIHGALCFSYSGQCLLSSMIGGRSGNRGYCAQPCRKKYRMNGVEGYLLSPRDLNMSEHIGSLIGAGIDSFKIEGRMKRPEYVAGVVGVYRKLIDRYSGSPENFRVTEAEKHTLRQLFNREFTTGYFFGSPEDQLMSREYPHNRGTELGRVVDLDIRKKQASIYLKAPLRAGDGIGIGGRDSGIIVRDMYTGSKRTAYANPGSVVELKIPPEADRGDAVFKTFDSLLMASLRTKDSKNNKKIPVRMSFTARSGEHTELRISDGENEAVIQGGIAGQAEGRPISESLIARQLKKLGNTIFEAHEIAFDIGDNIFIPVSELNSLRRAAVARLERERTLKWKRQCKRPEITFEKKEVEYRPGLSVNTGSVECLEAAISGGAEVVYIDKEAFDKTDKNDYSYAIEYGREKGVSVFISTPRIAREIGNLDTHLNPDGFLVANAGILYYLSRLYPIKPIVVDYPLNVFNRLTMEHFLNYSQRVTLSPELTLDEIRDLTPSGPTECIVHGLFPLMISEHNLVGCLFPQSDIHDAALKDDRGFAFPVMTDTQGRTFIMNSRELCMLEHVPDIIKAGVSCLRIEATMYDKESTKKITQAYRRAIDDSTGSKRMGNGCSNPGDFTTGHYFRGVL